MNAPAGHRNNTIFSHLTTSFSNFSTPLPTLPLLPLPLLSSTLSILSTSPKKFNETIPNKVDNLSTAAKFATAGGGGILGWWVVHPFNTLAVRMNLLSATLKPSEKLPSFFTYSKNMVQKNGVQTLYDGIGAGTMRQIFYATSRFGLFEVLRDQMAETLTDDGIVTVPIRLSAGLMSGGMAAVIACPAEVTLVRMSNDMALPSAQRRNYKHFGDAASRILSEEGIAAFWRGVIPFAQRAVVVGVCQVGTFDQGKEFYASNNIAKRGTTFNVFCAAMTSGLFYALVTMPLESAKNRMASQPSAKNAKDLMYKSTVDTIRKVVKKESVVALWNGFLPYYLRCGGHTTTMFIFVEWLRQVIA